MAVLGALEYFYGAEAEQYTFYRIPKVLFTDPGFKQTTGDAKILYGLMLDAWSFPYATAGWTNKNGCSSTSPWRKRWVSGPGRGFKNSHHQLCENS